MSSDPPKKPKAKTDPKTGCSHGGAHCIHVFRRCCKCGEWMYKGGHGPFMHLPQGTSTPPINTRPAADDLKSRNLSTRTTPPPQNNARPAADSVQEAIHGMIGKK